MIDQRDRRTELVGERCQLCYKPVDDGGKGRRGECRRGRDRGRVDRSSKYGCCKSEDSKERHETHCNECGEREREREKGTRV